MSDRRFKIVSVGWRCADWWEQTLRSIEEQSIDRWDVAIGYDGGDDAGPLIEKWCAERDGRWQCTINDTQQFAVRNQVEAIARLAPGDDDVVVFLDLDGDRLAHAGVLAELDRHYDDGVLVTYGSYRPVPHVTTTTPASPFPADVVAANSYRRHMLSPGGSCHFNHLRTISGRVANAIPPDQFRWPKGPRRGEFYVAGTDYIFMVAALELAGGRYRCIPDVLLLYNHANPLADYLFHPADADACTQNFLRRPPLEPLPDPTPGVTVTNKMLSAEDRREVLRDYGRRYELSTLVETGTNDGGTPWALKEAFDQIFTIELGDKQWRAAVRRFADYPHIHCLHGDSAVVLPEVLAKLSGPALFWLDGHWSGGTTAHGPKDTPVIEELEAIVASPWPHVVLVDDARLFDGMPEHDEQPAWPHIDEVRAIADAHGYTFVIDHDIVRLTSHV